MLCFRLKMLMLNLKVKGHHLHRWKGNKGNLIRCWQRRKLYQRSMLYVDCQIKISLLANLHRFYKDLLGKSKWSLSFVYVQDSRVDGQL